MKQETRDRIRRIVQDVCQKAVPDLTPGLDPVVDRFIEEQGEALLNVCAGPYPFMEGVFGSTEAPGRIYLHILDPEAFSKVKLKAPEGRVLDIELIHGTPLFFMITEDDLFIDVPRAFLGEEPADVIVVITCEQN